MSQDTFLLNYTERSKKLLLQCVAFATKSLSPDALDSVHRDLYGKGEVQEETDAFIDEKLSELDRAIGIMDKDLTSAYREAVDIENERCTSCQTTAAIGGDVEDVESKQQSYYVTSRKFRVMFLRCEQYHAFHAARRLTKYFRDKLEMFGRDKLACRITQADLNDEEKALLSAGCVSVTGATDNHGRLLIFHRPQMIFSCNYSSISSVKRVFFYVYQHAIEDHELSQKKGFVCIHHNMGTNAILRPSEITDVLPVPRLIHRALPVRFAAGHLCYNSLMEHFFLNLVFVLLPNHEQARIQSHYKRTPTECIAELRAYGIDPNILPFTEEGDFRYDIFDKYLQRLCRLEEEESRATTRTRHCKMAVDKDLLVNPLQDESMIVVDHDDRHYN